MLFWKQKKKKELYAQRPLEEVIFSRIDPWPDIRAGEAAGGRIPAWGLTGGGGEVGEKLHGVERNSGVGSVGARDGRSGGSAKSSGRRSGGRGRRRAGRGAPVEAKGASCGGCWTRGRAEEGAPREPRARRR